MAEGFQSAGLELCHLREGAQLVAKRSGGQAKSSRGCGVAELTNNAESVEPHGLNSGGVKP